MTLTPPLKWAGGKRWLVPYLAPVWEQHKNRRLVEPFCGGLAVTLGLSPSRALLNDVNPHLINFYCWLQRGLEVELSPGDNSVGVFYQRRDRFNTLIQNQQADSSEAAALFYYLNRTCFNGLCRFNKSGLFNVPFGKYSKIKYSTTKDFQRYISVLEPWNFTYGDFERLEVQENDFVYADPPYDVEFTQYSSESFRWEDQIRLAKWLSQLRVPVIISNQATERVIELYQAFGFAVQTVLAPRMINSTGDRTPAKEVLASKNVEKAKQTVQMPLF